MFASFEWPARLNDPHDLDGVDRLNRRARNFTRDNRPGDDLYRALGLAEETAFRRAMLFKKQFKRQFFTRLPERSLVIELRIPAIFWTFINQHIRPNLNLKSYIGVTIIV